MVVAKRNLPEGQTLTVADLTVRDWPRNSLPPGSFNQVKNLDGRVVKTRLIAGEPVLKAKLSPKGLRGGLSAVVAPGMRAVTVKVDEVIGVGDFVQPRDRVDVIVTVNRSGYSKNPAARIVLQDVEVLAVEKNPRVETGGGKKKSKSKLRVATLQLTPADAEKLALASTEGKLLLSLRNQADHRAATTKGVRLDNLIKGPVNPPGLDLAKLMPEIKPKEKPKPAAPPETKIEVIKGITRSEQRLSK
ncbi:pilus assembly protein CpaB [Dethiosulfatarculus sandiegensis]|uniref:Pilus assembly protein CpaB n=1 Tax=Dethiosulfatarculus sandiegensis TaxID=1429043 RepID=A0A0D2GFU6_9BACT|nr:pilus assembly protein CpaB [Dethiosulfatarculus sandiegensis]